MCQYAACDRGPVLGPVRVLDRVPDPVPCRVLLREAVRWWFAAKGLGWGGVVNISGHKMLNGRIHKHYWLLLGQSVGGPGVGVERTCTGWGRGCRVGFCWGGEKMREIFVKIVRVLGVFW